MAITSFTGPYTFLSNFYNFPVEGWHGDPLTYSSVEHAYQAAKTTDLKVKYAILHTPLPRDAKRKGRKIKIREDWEEIKLDVMEFLLRCKFADPCLSDLLLSTFPHDLVEGNWWGDRFWGVSGGVGENHLGKILMRIREEQREQAP